MENGCKFNQTSTKIYTHQQKTTKPHPFQTAWRALGFHVQQKLSRLQGRRYPPFDTPRKTNKCPLKINGWSRCISY